MSEKDTSALSGGPKVSIGVPVFNGERFLVQALEVILGQTHEDLEVVISDNASTDKTEDICRDFAARDQRVRYHRSDQNRGAAANYNRVFSLSRGQYFKWAAADDLFSNDYIERCVAVLDSEPLAVLAFARTEIIDEHGMHLRDYDDNLHLPYASVRQRFARLLEKVGECNAVFGVIRSSTLAASGLIGNYIASDVVLLVELSLHGQFHQVDERLFLRREHSEASSWDKNDDAQQEFFDPAIKGRQEMGTWRHTMHRFRAAARAPLALDDRCWVILRLLRRAITARRALGRELASRVGFQR